MKISGDDADERARSSALHVLSVALAMNGDLEAAREKMYERMELERRAGSSRLVAAECSNLSSVERQLGNLEQAKKLAIQALEMDVERDDVWSVPYPLNQLAALAVELGEMERAATLLGASAHMLEGQGADWPPDEAPVFEASVSTAQRELGRDVYEIHAQRGRRMQWREAAEYALNGWD